MKKIRIADVTLSAAGKDLTLSFKEKLEIAKYLDRARIDVLELPQLRDQRTDALLMRTVSTTVQNCAVSIAAGLTPEEAEQAWAAVSKAKKPRLRVVAPVSTVQMEYLCHKKPAAMEKTIEEMVKKCRSLCPDVEFVAEDATRAEQDFLRAAISCAVKAGATVVTVSDTAGMMLPEEFASFLRGIREAVPELGEIDLAVKCSDELQMAAAAAMTAARDGAVELKACASGGSLPTLTSLGQIFRVRGDSIGLGCGMNFMELQRITGQIQWITRSKRSDSSAFDTGVGAGSGESFALTGSDDIHEVEKAVIRLGYDLSPDDLNKVYESFHHIAQKKEISSVELEAIIATVALQVPPSYKLSSFIINSGNLITATSNMVLEHEGKMLQGVTIGDGPIDASFLAIERIVGTHYDLDDFQIQSLTEGHEAVGSAIVKLRSASGKLYSGRGVSTDIVGAAIRAYINALNKIIYEEN